MRSEAVRRLNEAQAAAERDLDELGSIYGQRHPNYVRVQERVAQLRANLEAVRKDGDLAGALDSQIGPSFIAADVVAIPSSLDPRMVIGLGALAGLALGVWLSLRRAGPSVDEMREGARRGTNQGGRITRHRAAVGARSPAAVVCAYSLRQPPQTRITVSAAPPSCRARKRPPPPIDRCAAPSKQPQAARDRSLRGDEMGAQPGQFGKTARGVGIPLLKRLQFAGDDRFESEPLFMAHTAACVRLCSRSLRKIALM